MLERRKEKTSLSIKIFFHLWCLFFF